MMVFKLYFLPTLLGFLVLASLLKNTPLRHKPLFLLGASLPTGFGICSLFLFFFYLLNPFQAKSMSLITVASIILFFAYVLWPWCKFPYRFPLFLKKDFLHNCLRFQNLIWLASLFLFLATLFATSQHFFLSAALNISGGWDARYLWSLKSEFMFRIPGEWLKMFSPQLAGTHLDYPLLLPATLAWGWHCLGYESLIAGPWIAFGFYISCAFLLTWYLSERISPIAGWIGGAFFFSIGHYFFWSVAQYADVPLAFFITACGFLMILTTQFEQKKLFIASGLMGGLASWTKNEGLLFLFWAYCVLAIILFLKYRGRIKEAFKILMRFASGSFVPLLATLILKGFLGTTGDYLGSARTWQDYGNLLFSDFNNTLVIFKAFFVYMISYELWKGLWLFFAIGTIVLIFRKKNPHPRYAWILFGLVTLINLGYIIVFHFTPYHLDFQIRTALDRLLLHSGILAIAFSFEALTVAQQKSNSEK